MLHMHSDRQLPDDGYGYYFLGHKAEMRRRGKGVFGWLPITKANK